MYRLIAVSALVMIFSLGNQTNATWGQDFDQYGLRANRNQAASQTSPTRNMLDFSRSNEQKPASPFQGMFSNSGEKKPFRLFEKMEMPKVEWPKLQMPKLQMPKLARPSWLPERDPNAPNFFQRMNTKSKDAIDRFTSWAQGKSSNFKQRQSASWDSIRATMDQLNAQNGSASQAPSARTASGGTLGGSRY